MGHETLVWRSPFLVGMALLRPGVEPRRMMPPAIRTHSFVLCLFVPAFFFRTPLCLSIFWSFVLILVSVVSHGHGIMTPTLVQRLSACPEVSRIIWTKNIPEPAKPFAGSRVEIVENTEPKGFGANHNAAFHGCQEPYFCILNPDIEWTENPFPGLMATLARENAALVAPQILSPVGRIEDSMRRYPTVQSLFAKALYGEEGRAPLIPGASIVYPDWVAGMFMLVRSADFSTIGGFDEDYFLYYEDIELCSQLKVVGRPIVGDLSVHVTHRAQRASHHDWQHMKWHLTSMLRYLWRHTGIRLRPPA
jgi:hypothetical protein